MQGDDVYRVFSGFREAASEYSISTPICSAPI